MLIVGFFIKKWKFYLLLGLSSAIFSSSPNFVFATPSSEMLTNVPIKDFVLPFFGTDGSKGWQACGEVATMNTFGDFDVENAQLFCFEESSNSAKEQFRAVSKKAIVMPNTHRASGQSEIKIFGENFSASATNWEFFGDLKKIVAKNNVKVLLDGDLTEFSR